jgi:flagellar hook-length control protein FliK
VEPPRFDAAGAAALTSKTTTTTTTTPRKADAMLTLIQSASTLRVAQADAAPNPANNAPVIAGNPTGFASLLRQSQGADASPARPNPPEAAPEKAAENEPPADASITERPHPMLKGKLRQTEIAKPLPRNANDVGGVVAKAEPYTSEYDATETKATTAEAVDPNAVHAIAAAVVADRTEAVPKKAAGERDGAVVESASPAKPPHADALPTDVGPKDKAAPVHDHTGGAAIAMPSFAAALTEPRRPQEPLSAPGDAVAKDNAVATAAASAAASMLAPVTPTPAPPPTAVAITTPVSSPEFAQELGLRLTTLVEAGTQRAELHLNPAEMGPVSITIVLDGTQARIDFVADIAATRHAIEAGIPSLAGALQDAGFTLAGGGVSQHAGGRGGDHPGAGSHGAKGARRMALADEVSNVAAIARRVVTNGGVDLFV